MPDRTRIAAGRKRSAATGRLSGKTAVVPSRREFLIGAGAVVAVGAAGAVGIGDHRRTSLLHRLGLEKSPDNSVPDSHTPTESGTLTSKHMTQPVKWTLAIPAGALSGVVYCLHGRGADHRFAFDQIHVPDVAAFVGARVAVAAVDGGEDSYWHARANGDDPHTMLLDEFIPMIERRVHVEKRALLGWSMGGYGALLAAEREPTRFAAVAAASPALFTTAGATVEGAFDDAGDYHRNDVFADVDRLAAPMVVRIDCGSADSFYGAARTFASDLPNPPQGTFGAGFHDNPYWRSVAPAQLRTINAAFAAR